jgi:hypothetical protein
MSISYLLNFWDITDRPTRDQKIVIITLELRSRLMSIHQHMDVEPTPLGHNAKVTAASIMHLLLI